MHHFLSQCDIGFRCRTFRSVLKHFPGIQGVVIAFFRPFLLLTPIHSAFLTIIFLYFYQRSILQHLVHNDTILLLIATHFMTLFIGNNCRIYFSRETKTILSTYLSRPNFNLEKMLRRYMDYIDSVERRKISPNMTLLLELC